MKRKLKYKMKKYKLLPFLLSLTMIIQSVLVNAQTIIMPMPVNFGAGGGNMKDKDLIALWIALNIISVLIILIRSIIWYFKKDKHYSYFEYVFWNNFSIEKPDVNLNSIWLIMVNGLAFLVVLVEFISKIIS